MRGITNAQQKNGVTTINTIAPDADNDFTIEAGTGVTITSGTNKITINAAGGGTTWTKRTPNNDWSDIFEYTNSRITAKKDLMIYYDQNDAIFTGPIFIPKGYSTASSMMLPHFGSFASNNTIDEYSYVRITNSRLGGSYPSFYRYYYRFTFNIDFDNKTFSISKSSASNAEIEKSIFLIYTRD